MATALAQTLAGHASGFSTSSVVADGILPEKYHRYNRDSSI